MRGRAPLHERRGLWARALRRRALRRAHGDGRQERALEGEIGGLEEEQKELEARLADPALYSTGGFAATQPLLTRLQQLKGTLQERYQRWEEKNDELARLG